VTAFLDDHPGGAELITDINADDFKLMTKEFQDAEHSEEAMEQLQTFFVGVIKHKNHEDIEEEEEEEEQHTMETNKFPSTPFYAPTELNLLLK
jgi:cytochrome b involved in lipid metabolism